MARVKVFMFVAALLPMARLVIGSFTNHLGTNPLEFITRSTGTWSLVFLCVTLAVTPARKLTGWQWLAQTRRMFGLFAFFYAACHFVTFVWFDHFFDVGAIWSDVFKRPFITAGFAAFLLLIPLAMTSSHAMVRRVGARCWQALHRLVYFIAVLGVVHYWWLVKRDITQPIIYLTVLGVLLGMRLWWRLLSKRTSS